MTPVDLHEVALFVTSPDGHADEARLQAGFAVLRACAPVIRVEPPGTRPFWLVTRHADIASVERRDAPFIVGPRTFLSSEAGEAAMRQVSGKPDVLRGLVQMDDPDHALYREVSARWFTAGGLAGLQDRITAYACAAVARIAACDGVFDFVPEVAVAFPMRVIMLAGGLHALLTHKAALAKLWAEPALLDRAIEEMLRWTSPARHLMRTATAETEIGGQRIAAGEAVALFFNSANRDERVFNAPEEFRIDRAPNPHLAFGLGPHFCLGAHLARLEMRALFGALLPALPTMEVAGPIRRTRSAVISGIASLPLRCAWRM